MKKFLAALLIGLSLVTFTLDASAARLGGGASFGRSMSVPKASPSFPKAAPSTANVRQLPLQPVQPQRLNQAVSGAAS